VFLYFNFVKICLPKSKWCQEKQGKNYSNTPKPQRAHNVLNLSDEVKILDFLKGGLSLMEDRWGYGNNESSICIFKIQNMKCGLALIRSSNVYNSNF
jgi:hypothetical protein